MKKELRYALKDAFEPPNPIHREEFLRNLPMQKKSFGEFLLQQLPYIRKRTWLVSCLLFAVFFVSPRENWMAIPSLLPFLALIGITELARSSCCRMAELEMSCRFNLSQVLLARMFWLGLCSFPVLLMSLFTVGKLSAFDTAQILLYVLTPYLLTCAASLLILNILRATEGIYGCAAVTCMVSISNGIFQNTDAFYQSNRLIFWLLAACFSAATTILQLFIFLKKTEESPWNLFLIK